MKISSLNGVRMFVGAVLLIASSSIAIASDTAKSVSIINQWYAAISASQSPDEMASNLEPLLDQQLRIVLSDLDITQNRADFVGSLDNWADAIKDGFLAHRIDSDAMAGKVTAIVCYGFGDNAMLSREVFTLANGKITESVQTKIGDDCADF